STFSPDEQRTDFRHIEHITIDGETARDFDDAVCVKKSLDGFQLYVSIADVSHFIRPGSHLDKEAYVRGTSIYFPGRVIPMLPEQLSNNLCSLTPGQDRFTVTAILDFDLSGNLLKKKFVRSVIRSYHRFTYTTVKQIVMDKTPQIRLQHEQFLSQLDWARELAELLLVNRQKRGAIGFTLAEPEITLTESGEIAAISSQERNFAHQIIEEFMLAANEAVAELFTQSGINALYRVHEPPDFEKVEDFYTFSRTLDLQLPQPVNSPEWFAGVVEQCKGKKTEYLVNNLLLRTMKQAHYSPENTGHFGLASRAYTHFTSPIRRYPDLLVHRLLLQIIERNPSQPKISRKDLKLQEKGEFLSARERSAIKAEREMNDRLKVRYMKKHLGENFEGIISGVNDFAMFIELKGMAISGSIGVSELKDDYYIHDEKNYRLIGELSGTVYQVGDLIRVTLIDVDSQRNRISFIPSPEKKPAISDRQK
ncbi:MAG: VacB/RNase II family 3'-5' exoribonuclease, partial [Deltaproteobacteria bacterium]|nr:VacB/RNase II family 3'-5' exoribonuclease [Deltaproteobacteria bacterium]